MTLDIPLDVQAINRTQRLAFLTNDTVVPITTAFDSNGDECDPTDEEAVVLVAGEDGRGWFAIDLEQFTGNTH